MTEIRSSEEPTSRLEEVEHAEGSASQAAEVESIGEASLEPEGGSVVQPGATTEEPAAELEEKAITLSHPSPELAARLLSKVSFEDRTIGVRTHPGPGGKRQYIYSFEQAVSFLKVEDEVLNGGDGWVCDIHFDALKKWIGETLGDKELAQALGEMTKEYDNCADPLRKYWKGIVLIRPIKALMWQRLEQCKEVAGETAT
jgi:hypothetical protein